MFLAMAAATNTYAIESETILYLGFAWILYKLILPLIIVTIFIIYAGKICGWFVGISKNYFEWKKSNRIVDLEADSLFWEHQIGDRVKKLDEIKDLETKIRQEVDKLNEVKIEKDKTNQEI